MSLYFAVIIIDAIVVFGANRMNHAMCIQTTVKSPVSLQVLGTISNRGISLLRKLNGDMDSAKYQSDIIHDVEITREWVVLPQKGYIFSMISRHGITLNVLRHY